MQIDLETLMIDCPLCNSFSGRTDDGEVCALCNGAGSLSVANSLHNTFWLGGTTATELWTRVFAAAQSELEHLGRSCQQAEMRQRAAAVAAGSNGGIN